MSTIPKVHCYIETGDGGMIALVEQPEGFLLRYHGEVVWRSWEHAPVQRKHSISLTISVDPEGDLQRAIADMSALLAKVGQ